MFQLKHHTRKGHKTKLFAAVAYALVGLLASGSAYAATADEVDAKLNNLTAELANKEKAFQELIKSKEDIVKMLNFSYMS